MKKKFLYYSLDRRDTTAFWRFSCLKYISNPDFDLVDISSEKMFDWSSFVGYEGILMQRPFCLEHAQILTAAKNIGLKIILDFDDLLLEGLDGTGGVDMFNPTYQLYKSNQHHIKACVKLADEIWASTEEIKRSFMPYCANIHIIPNSHNDYLFKPKDKRPFTANNKCFYRGGSSHQADVNSVANELIAVINNNKNWIFTFCGDRYTYLELNSGDNYHIVGGMTIMEYFRFVNGENPAVMIFPLCDTKFNRGKSNISFIESVFSGSSFYGNKKLPEFNLECISDISTLGETLNHTDHKAMNELAWEYITDTLLLSKINNLRTERILANL